MTAALCLDEVEASHRLLTLTIIHGYRLLVYKSVPGQTPNHYFALQGV